MPTTKQKKEEIKPEASKKTTTPAKKTTGRTVPGNKKKPTAQKKTSQKKSPVKAGAKAKAAVTKAGKSTTAKSSTRTPTAKKAGNKQKPAGKSENAAKSKAKSNAAGKPKPKSSKKGKNVATNRPKTASKTKSTQSTTSKPAPKTQPTAKTKPIAKPKPAPKSKPTSKAKPAKTAKSVPDAKPTQKSQPIQKHQHPNKPRRPNQAKAQHTASKPAEENKTQSTGSSQEYKLLINADSPEECRVALLEKGKLTSFHVETVVSAQQKGNIYKGKVVSVEANLQAAFVDIGTGKNAFLAFNEIHPEYYLHEKDQDTHWKDLNIKDVIKEGQELLVEVAKEVTGNKGANITTLLSLPGRYVVLMPGSTSKGISRKIEKDSQRKKLREMLDSCKLPEGVGYIIRTASNNITKTALTQDVKFLIKLWKDIKEKGQSQPSPSLVYQEQNIVARFLRDHFTSDIQEIMVDSQDAYDQVVNFLELLPAAQRKITAAKLHKGPRPLLNSFNVEKQIEQIYHPNVKLPSGGSIVINPTEALVAIDVNSGRTDKKGNFEETIFLANMEAAEELARQLQLRDLGGLIVVDFIDMRMASHTREVERKVKSSMKRDKAKVDFCRISKFGLMQISRQRMAAPVLAGNYKTCTHCQGRGIVKSVETQALIYLREIQTGVTRRKVNTVKCLLPFEVGQYLLNKKRAELAEMERRYKTAILIETDADLTPSQANIQFIKE